MKEMTSFLKHRHNRGYRYLGCPFLNELSWQFQLAQLIVYDYRVPRQ
jgi:hypothetical protein